MSRDVLGPEAHVRKDGGTAGDPEENQSSSVGSVVFSGGDGYPSLRTSLVSATYRSESKVQLPGNDRGTMCVEGTLDFGNSDVSGLSPPVLRVQNEYILDSSTLFFGEGQ